MQESSNTQATIKSIKMTPAQEAQTLEQRKLLIDKKAEEVAKLEPAGEDPVAKLDEVPVDVLDNKVVEVSLTQLADIILAASNGRRIHIAPVPSTAKSATERIMDDTLGAVGDGAQRMADGIRDVIGGAIEIATLGRTRNGKN